ncbi:aspartate aminotransferase family protein [candidate division KSB1 bacterium]|nr:aspartate aminotransferase family protein [candidate division KSB1 bacterium]
MPVDEFRQRGYALIDWIADYFQHVESMPVLSRVEPGEIRAMLPPSAPQHGESFETILSDIDRIILPGITHWQSPNWFAFFPANSSEPSILGELLSAGLGVQGMLWATSPACTELETQVLDWLVDMLGLPADFKSNSAGGGVIQDTASSATLAAVLAGRERATQFQSNANGCDGKLVAYCSTQAHSSIDKAIKIAGIGINNLRKIEIDDTFAMQPMALVSAIEQDIADGLVPCFVNANVGSTSSNAIDPAEHIGQICRRFNIWLHVDAAMSGSAAICPEFRLFLNKGLEYADSYCFNPHKWLFTNFDCDVFYVRDRQALIDTFTLMPEYLRNKATESGAVIDYRDWHIQLGRRFRALKLWFVIRHYGIEGLQFHIRQHIRLAQIFADWIRASQDFEIVVEPPLNLVCFRHLGGDAKNQKIMDKLNADGHIYLTHTRLNNQLVLRMSIGQTKTEERHVRRAWELIQEAAQDI